MQPFDSDRSPRLTKFSATVETALITAYDPRPHRSSKGIVLVIIITITITITAIVIIVLRVIIDLLGLIPTVLAY